MNLNDVNKLWYDGPVDGISFRLNDCVRIRSGKHTGEFGSVICIESVEPIAYVVELGKTGLDVVIAESELEAIPSPETF